MTLALFLAGIHLFVTLPASRKQVRTRFEALQESVKQPQEFELKLAREEVGAQLSWLNRLFAETALGDSLKLLLRQAGVNQPLPFILLLSLAAGLGAFLLTLLLRQPLLLVLAASLLAFAVPFLVVAVKRRRRLARFEESFPDSLDLLARAVRAGHAFTTGFELIAQEMPDPVASEFRTTYEQQNLGLPLQTGLYNLAQRVPLVDVRVFTTAIQIQRESGGNLAEILEKLSSVIRERFKLRRHVKAKTAEGRLSLYFLTALPVLTGLVFYLASPEYMEPLFTEPLGHQLMGAAAVSQMIGYVVIRRITTIKV